MTVFSLFRTLELCLGIATIAIFVPLTEEPQLSSARGLMTASAAMSGILIFANLAGWLAWSTKSNKNIHHVFEVVLATVLLIPNVMMAALPVSSCYTSYTKLQTGHNYYMGLVTGEN